MDILCVFTLDFNGIFIRRSDDGQAGVLDGNALFHGQINARQQHIEAVDIYIAFHLHTSVSVSVIASVAVLRRVGGNDFQHKTRLGRHG